AAKTTIAPYSLRGRLTPPVAAPRTWDEFDDPAAVEQLRFEEVLDRLDDDGDLLESLTEATGGSVEAPQERDRLGIDRSRRDAHHTHEPIPARSGASGS